MANSSPLSPTNQHFFQPLLSEFQSHLKIPEKFFSDHIKGKHEGVSVKLRTDVSKTTWQVRMDGNRLTGGWKEFVEAHALKIGDFVVFKHEGDMSFHVTALGPNWCEIQYIVPESSRHKEGQESDDDIENSSRSKDMQKEPDLSSPDVNCFSQNVTTSNKLANQVNLPKDFARRNGFDKGRHEIVLMNDEGKTWESIVKSNTAGQVFIGGGWTSFCNDNNLKVGVSCTFQLLQNEKMPVFRLVSRTENKKKIRSRDDSGDHRFVKLVPTHNSLASGKQHIPVSFMKGNGLVSPGEITLVDKNNDEWPMKLKHDKRGAVYITGGNGWKRFCDKNNEVCAGETLTLELIRGGTSPLLKFCSKMGQTPFEAEDGTHKRARVQNEIREEISTEGEPSRASKKSKGDQDNLQQTQPCSVSDQLVAKVKQNVVDTLTSIREFMTELGKMERKLEDSLQKINKLGWYDNNSNISFGLGFY